DYGIPDYGNRSPADSAGRRLYERAIQRAIAAFEPRLIGPEVELETMAGRPSLLRARITGVLATGDIVEPVSFEIDLGARRAGVEFARTYPKVAARLEIGPEGSAAPHVERLIESFAYLAARVQRNIAAEFPKLVEALFSV